MRQLYSYLLLSQLDVFSKNVSDTRRYPPHFMKSVLKETRLRDNHITFLLLTLWLI